ncbi:BspA family leucine-rich repeat surface protein, partial [Enterococcus casseliflavus]|uniref:BspA family leucine-rich repeat surface protein n=1 Tax=Enterococcus casseliflavus TaxID=37734 RepID=UPI00232AE595
TAGTYVAEVEKLLWGTSPWSFDEETGVLTIEPGELGVSADSPWNRSDNKVVNSADIKQIILSGKITAPKDSKNLFSSTVAAKQLFNVEKIDGLANLDTSNVTSMSYMFNGLSQLKTIDVSNFDTQNVTTMNNMFWGLTQLRTIDVSNFDTSNVTNMSYMFTGLIQLKTIDLSNFDTQNVITMVGMFNGVGELSTLVLGENFKFVSDSANLSAPAALNEGDVLTGKWIREDGKSAAYTPTDFMVNYGTGDLTAGTYVAEVAQANVIFEQFDAIPADSSLHVNTVGQKSNGVLSFSNQGLGEAGEIILTEFTTQFELDPNGTSIVSYQSKEGVQQDETVKNTELVSGYRFKNLAPGERVELQFEGTPWNNSPLDNDEMDKVRIDYKNKNEEKNLVVKKTIQIESGAFGFKEVPSVLEFTPTKLSLNLNGQLIDRVDTNWGLSLKDYRGTNERIINDESGRLAADRQDWELTVTATPFIDNSDVEVDPSVLSLAYVEDRNIQYVNDQELTIEQHTVENETPQKDHVINVNWAQEEGLKVYVHNRDALKSKNTYQAEIEFSLRIAP